MFYDCRVRMFYDYKIRMFYDWSSRVAVSVVLASSPAAVSSTNPTPTRVATENTSSTDPKPISAVGSKVGINRHFIPIAIEDVTI